MKILELFSGYGTASFALKRLGIKPEIVGYSDIDRDANKCFRQNHGGKELGDVTKINPYELEDFELLTGGFPCQAFSSAGKGLGELDTRGTLFNEIIRIAEVKQPKYMLLENVKGILANKHKKTFDKILEELDRIGYIVKWRTYNTKNYGIPQNRERVFFVCFHKDYYNYGDWEEPEEVELKILFKDLLLDLPFRDIPKFQYGLYANKRRIELLKTTDDEVFHTITTNRTHQNQYLLNPERTKCRLFNKVESFRLQGFNDGEINLDGFSGNQAHRLAGNGQSVNVVAAIFKNMFANLGESAL